MNEIIRKLSSRKLWLAIAGIATGVAMALGADSNEVREIAGAVTALVSAVTYIVVEGRIDAEGVKHAIVEVQEGIGILEGADDQ